MSRSALSGISHLRNVRRHAALGRAASAMVEFLESRTLLSGGGWSGGGILGSYYTNSTESGTPSFTRTDVRLDWAETGVAPGGSAEPAYSAVGATGWSASWAGNLLPKFSESYTFQMVADGKVNMQISPNGTSWTTLINTTTSLGGQTLTSSSYAMTAGQSYDVKITFAQQNNPSDLDWGLSLRWSSPSTPLETISPANALGVDPGFVTDFQEQYEFANAFYQGGAITGATDSHGNPTEDFNVQIYEGTATEPGTYLITGTDTTKPTAAPTITAYGTGTVGAVTYAPSTGVFSAKLTGVASNTNGGLSFTHTAGGVTGLKVMRPTSPGATTSNSPSLIWNPDFEALFSDFSAIRSMDLLDTNGTTQTTWSNRSLPSDAKLTDGQGADTTYAVPLEYLVELCNETGKDLYLNIPQEANNQYVTNEAELLKYGSDANGNPYTSPQANPVYAPLNENLHVYIEYSNEVWNYSFAQYGQNYNEAQQAFTDYRDGNTTAPDYADGEAIDYDGSTTMSGYIAGRYHAERTVDTSNIFRSVWGNSAMPGTSTSPSGPTIMPLEEWQYSGADNNENSTLQFVDDYYNNANGTTYSTTPHPVNYYIWGGGGAWYASSSNPNGTQEVSVTNPLFENGTTGWTFTGTSGVAPNGGTNPAPPVNAPNSTDAAYIKGTATLSQQVTVTTATMVQVDFFGAYTGNGDQFNVLVDGNNIGTFTPGGDNSVYDNQTLTYNYQQYGNNEMLYTLGINVSAGTHTVEIEGLGGTYTGYSFIEDVQIDTEDGIFNGTHLVTPQAGSIIADAQLATAYGLQYSGYEGGYDDGPTSVFGQDNIQTAADSDPRVETFTEQAVNQFFQDGGALGMQFGLAGGGTWSLAQSTYVAGGPTPKEQAYQQVTTTLPAAPTNGIAVAATLTSTNTSYTLGTSGSTLSATGSWFSWNVLVPTTGTYAVSATCSGSGATAELLADGSKLIASGATGTISGTIFLTAGLHGIKIQSTSGAVNVSQVTIVASGAPATPTITTSTAGNGQESLTWSAVTGASGYEIFYGTNQGNLTSSTIVSAVTSTTVTGLTNADIYYFAVAALNSSGDSLPSAQVVGLPLAEGESAKIANWFFTGEIGSETAAPLSAASSYLTATSITRGPGLPLPIYDIPSSTIDSEASTWGQSLAAAISDNQYYQLTITPVAGQSLSLQTLNYSAWFQNAGESGQNLGTGITYNVNGGTFSTGIAATGSTFADYGGSAFSVNLSGQSSLQGATSPIVIRVYLYGNEAAECSGLGVGSLTVTGSANSVIPATPTITSYTAGSGQVSLTWSTATGATGYEIFYGTTQGTLTSSTSASATSGTVSSLTNGTPYYFAVSSTNSGGTSAPSSEVGALPLAEGESAKIANWSFTGESGNETAAPLTLASSYLTASSITRGSGLPLPVYDVQSNSIDSEANPWGQSLAAAISDNEYYQFTITPVAGQSLSLQTLNYSAWFQNAPESGQNLGTGITYNVNGGTFSTGIAATGSSFVDYGGSGFSVNLGGQSSLQGATSPIVIRVYLYGNLGAETNGLGAGALSVTGSANPVVPATPTITTYTAGSGQVSLAWGTESGVTGYEVFYGTTQGTLTSSTTVGNVTNDTVTGLTNGTSYYFAVAALNSTVTSSPSSEVGAVPLAEGESAKIANWSFLGESGNETAAPVTSATSYLTASSITRGSGLPLPVYDVQSNSIDSEPGTWGQSLAAAISDNEYYQFTITPASGQSLSLQTLNYSAWFQNAGESGQNLGTGITYNVNGGTFSTGIAATGSTFADYGGSAFSVNLSGQTSLQGDTSPIVIRVYLYGNEYAETSGLGAGALSVTGSANAD